MSQTTVLSNSHYNLRVTYDITSTQVIFYTIEGMSTDGYESMGYSSTLYLNSSAMMTGTVRFPGNYYYTIWSSSGGWGTSEFAGFFYATSCGGASNLKFWYEFSRPSTKYTFTLKTTTGVASFTGGGTYESGTSVKTVATASTGYKLSKYVETESDGTSSTWTECAGLTTHTDTWVIKRNRTVTAYATPITTKVIFDKNDGSGKTYSESYTAGNKNSFGMNLTDKSGQFGTWDRTGYKLLGWSTSKTATSATWPVYSGVTDNWIQTNQNGITIYAVWQPITAKVTFDKNDGTGKTYSESYTVGSSNSFGMNLEEKTGQFGLWDRTGYTLLGWSESKTATSPSWPVYATVTDNWIVTNKNGITIYAVWQINKYTISFNGNGGTGVPSNQTKTYGTNLTLSTIKPQKEATSSNGYVVKYEVAGGTLSKDSDTSLKITSYTFNKWKDQSGTLYASGGTYTKNQSDVLTAQWSTSISYSSIILPEASRPNCILLGWSTSAGGDVVYTAGQSITPSSNMTLYAVWEGRSVLYKNNGVWIEGLVYVRKNDTWKFGKMYTKQNDSWTSN